ncbi:MAG: hypothetical protein KDK70_09320 [Myxococcales bacterium]|nr:hypothetical protein [Myxococcales bacterium]
MLLTNRTLPPWLPLLLLAACEPAEADDDDHGALVAEVSSDECASGLRWVGGDEESPRMHPGGDCIGCHAREGEGPRYLVAGTVHDLLTEANDCFGVEGATVEITDADGRQWSLPTNEAGNFFLPQSEGPVAMPFRAAVLMDGMRLEMAAPQTVGSCATCHTAEGAMGAPGRVLAP